MFKIILIETSTAACSVAICSEGRILAHRESATARDQAARTAPFVKEVLDECGLSTADCDAVCVSAGPGSYTGLRVGVSSAKGLCFAADKPLIAVGTLDILAYQAIRDHLLPQGCKYIVPMIDARRMEVYTATFDCNAKRLDEVEALIVEPGRYDALLDEGPVLFIGDGAGKCSDALKHPNAFFVQTCPCATAMAVPAEKAFNEGKFENTAYYEPFYLKQFQATVSRKKLF